MDLLPKCCLLLLAIGSASALATPATSDQTKGAVIYVEKPKSLPNPAQLLSTMTAKFNEKSANLSEKLKSLPNPAQLLSGITEKTKNLPNPAELLSSLPAKLSKSKPVVVKPIVVIKPIVIGGGGGGAGGGGGGGGGHGHGHGHHG